MTLFKKLSVLLTILMVMSLVLAACGSEEPESAEEAETTAEEGAEPAATEEPEEAAEPAVSDKYGGVLRHAYYAPGFLDPAFLSSVADDELGKQWHDFLVFIGEDNQPDVTRGVAESWEVSDDGLAWTFKLRQGVLFHDGKEMTSRDVKFTFDRLRDPEVGAATVVLYENIADIEASDDYTVVFHLTNPNPDFLKDLGDYHALIMDADATDFATDWNGTGPFMIESYVPEERVVFTRNPNYWLKDDEGNQLPYLDGMEFIFLSDPAAQVDALRGGQVDYVLYLPTEYVQVLRDDPNTEVLSARSNTTWLIRMRSDEPPFDDNLVRRAVRMATDRAAILEGTISGLGVTGRDTPFGPVFGDFYLDIPELERDVEGAKALLAEAGYPDGFEIDMSVQETSPAPAIATIWKEQLAEIGVTLNLQIIPANVYYGEELWSTVQLGITDWGSRPYPQPYLALAYTCNAPWNESHWCDAEVDEIAAMTAKEMDPAKRAEGYRRIQEIFVERGPLVVPFFVDNLWGINAKLKGLTPTSALGTAMDLRYAYFEE
ncbi:MAG: ABC transporter substrate-binding protein [Anaerolineae bacterium]|nr:ABC transporter substrate-binding protein [Anaerolineae bacterium]